MCISYCAVGEALLNDGMALVLFEALITPYYDTTEKIFMYFVRVLFISPLLGLAFGMGEISHQRHYITSPHRMNHIAIVSILFYFIRSAPLSGSTILFHFLCSASL